MSYIDQNDNLEIIQEFVQDCKDLLDDLEFSIITLGKQLEEDAVSKETINNIFRTFHSIKGGAGFLMMDNIKKVAHAAENLLDLIRSEKLTLTPGHIDLFVLSSDFIKEAIEIIIVELNDESLAEKATVTISLLEMAIHEGKVPEIALEDDAKTKDSDETPAEKIFDDKQNNEKEYGSEDTLKNVRGFEITPEMIDHFISESQEILTVFEEELLTWKEGSDDDEVIERLFRKIHTFKGNCGFIGVADLEKIAHHMESVLDAVKSGNRVNKEQVVKIFIQLNDLLIDTLERVSVENTGDIEHLELYLELIEDLLPRGYSIDGSFSSKTRVGEILVDKGVVKDTDVEKAVEVQQKPIGELLVDMGATKDDEVKKALSEQQKKRAERTAKASMEKKQRPILSKRQDIRVDIGKLDSLINLIGELVIANNMVAHNPDLEGFDIPNFVKSTQHMGKIVRELQETAMTIRMIPVAGLFKRMIRLVHDLSNKSGKKVDLKLFGEETEIDKTVVELITDPLVHIIRNSIDHGLESTEERKAAGKPQKGVVNLTAKHEEGEVWILIEDDGKGINRDKVLKKAIENGLVQGDGSDMKDKDVFKLIFAPGFSTADTITDISGRGVGMDVVKKNLEKIKGKVDIESTAGKGTKVTLRIPLTLAIIEGMRVRVGPSDYIIPLLVIKEFFKPENTTVTVSPDGTETVKLRNELLPVIRLNNLHDISSDAEKIEDGILIVIESAKTTIALFVDEIIGQQQTVIKGLSEYIGKVHGVSGCTILGDGGICLILDVDTLFEMNNEIEA